MRDDIKISEYDYDLPDDRIAKFPLDRRELSKLLIYRNGDISQRQFLNIDEVLPVGSLLVFNNTKVVRARIVMHKPSGARVEIFCLEPHTPADYERAFAIKESSVWHCIIGNAKKWKEGALTINFEYNGASCMLNALRIPSENEQLVRFEWDADITFGQLLEHLGKIPIPPYLNRESEEIDNSRYQTVYSKFEGSVAAPTAGLHFCNEIISQMQDKGFEFEEVTLHVGAGTFMPVKSESVTDHSMHTEHFEITLAALKHLFTKVGSVVAVGTTTVRTLESLTAIAWRIINSTTPDSDKPVGQWELYDIPADFDAQKALRTLINYLETSHITKLKAATRIMIMPGYNFRIVDIIITNFHQPKSTLLLLVSAFVGNNWKKIYTYALENNFRFLSYGDSSVLINK